MVIQILSTITGLKSHRFMLKMTAEPTPSLCQRPVVNGVPVLKPDGYGALGPGPWLNTWEGLTYPDIGVPGTTPLRLLDYQEIHDLSPNGLRL